MINKSIKNNFSAAQPSGNLHIGNYLGAIKQWVELQDKYNCVFSIVDYHAITVYQEPQKLREKILETAMIYLAAGIDSKNQQFLCNRMFLRTYRISMDFKYNHKNSGIRINDSIQRQGKKT